MPTLAQLQTLLGRYAGSGNTFADQVNQVIARLLPEGNWKGTKLPVRFVVYSDRGRNSVVTLGTDFETILAGTYQSPEPDNPPNVSACYGLALPVQNAWYETAISGPGQGVGSDLRRGIIRLEGRYTTFADWSDARKLRIKLEQDESPGGKIIVRGRLDGAKVFSQDGDNFIEGVAINYINATVTTTLYFDEPPYAIIKPVTKGRVSFYIVDDDNNETIVGWYEPKETVPSYSRFKVPACPFSSQETTNPLPVANAAFLAIIKKSFVPMVSSDDQSLILNVGALRLGLEALLKEDASDFARADQLWSRAIRLLQVEESNDVGASAEGVVQMDDTYAMQDFANELDAAVPGMMGWP